MPRRTRKRDYKPETYFLRVTRDASHPLARIAYRIETFVARPENDGQYQQMKELLGGGWLELFAHIDAEEVGDNAGRRIDFYCDEEGALKQLPLTGTFFGHLISGPVLITASQGETTYGLTATEKDLMAQLVMQMLRFAL